MKVNLKIVQLTELPAKAKINELISANGGNSIGQTSLPNAGTFGNVIDVCGFNHV